MTDANPFSVRNVRLFILFRIFFNARFYYPVFTVVFLDFGMSLEQFAILNAVWAATIVLLEVPSGALADTIGRRNLLRVTGIFMVTEMVLICFLPMGNIQLVFWVLLVNRVISGAAEAAASGADEALAYDSLEKEGMSSMWPRVLEVQMRSQSIAFFIALLTGAAVYDSEFLNRIGSRLGMDWGLLPETTMRFPLYLVLISSFVVLVITWRLREVHAEERHEAAAEGKLDFWKTTMAATRTTLSAGMWILRTPFALVVIAAGFLFDNVIRMVLTLNGQYYRSVDLPEFTWGTIGAAFSLLGIFMPTVSRRLAETRSPRFNFCVLVVFCFTGLFGMTFVLPKIPGLFPVMFLFITMSISGFLLSHYLNKLADSKQRATVLSFKGLAFNGAYFFVGLAYAALAASLRPGITDAHPGAGKEFLDDRVFVAALQWFPWYFVVTLVLFLGLALWKLRGHSEWKVRG